jgi:hypothetical protein
VQPWPQQQGGKNEVQARRYEEEQAPAHGVQILQKACQ